MNGEELIRTLSRSRVSVQRSLRAHGYTIDIYNPEKEIMLDGLEFIETEPELYHQPPAIPENLAQELMDQLWNAGLRPSGELSSIGEKEALKDHLSDMRNIVGQKLGIDL